MDTTSGTHPTVERMTYILGQFRARTSPRAKATYLRYAIRFMYAIPLADLMSQDIPVTLMNAFGPREFEFRSGTDDRIVMAAHLAIVRMLLSDQLPSPIPNMDGTVLALRGLLIQSAAILRVNALPSDSRREITECQILLTYRLKRRLTFNSPYFDEESLVAITSIIHVYVYELPIETGQAPERMMRMAISLYLGMHEQDHLHQWQVERTSSTRALATYGPVAITSRLASWFDHVGAGMWRFFNFFCFMVQKALDVIDPRTMPLTQDGGLHASMMRGYWRTVKDHGSGLTAPIGDDEVLGYVSDSAMDGVMELLGAYFAIKTSPQTAYGVTILQQLFNEYDFPYVWARAPTWLSDAEFEDSRVALYDVLAKACDLDRTFRCRLKKDWATILGALRDRARVLPGLHTTARAVTQWDELGLALGFHEDVIREEELCATADVWGMTPAGCDRMRCPLNDVIGTSRTFLRCSGCQKVLYCSVQCQKIEWKEGDHRRKCQQERGGEQNDCISLIKP